MKVLVVLFAILIFNLSGFCQNPASIDVTSLTILKPYISSAQVSMTAIRLPSPYQSPLTGGGGGITNTFESCRPCYLGTSFLTGFGWDGGANWFNGFTISGYGSDKTVKFYLISSSPKVALSPTIRLKNSTVFLTAPAEIQGKIEIYDGNTLIAVDDDVNLKGTLKAEFGQYRAHWSTADRRGFDFHRVTFSYSQDTSQ